MLQATIAKMPEQEAVYYMKRCVDAGLWVPGKNDDEPRMKENAAVSDQPSAGAAASVPSSANSTTDDVDWTV